MRGHMRLNHSSATRPAMSMTAAVTHLRVEVNPDMIARPLAFTRTPPRRRPRRSWRDTLGVHGARERCRDYALPRR